MSSQGIDTYMPSSSNRLQAFLKLEKLELYDLLKLKEIWHHRHSLQSFSNLRILRVRNCHSLLNVFPSHLLQSFQNLKEIEVDNCEVLEHVFDFQEYVIDFQEHVFDFQRHDEDVGIFPKLEILKLWKLPRLRRVIHNEDKNDNMRCFFSPSTTMDFHNLKYLDIRECGMEDVNTPTNGIVLFNEKFAFPRLEVLEIFHMENINKIWHDQLPTVESLGKLKKVSVSHCRNLWSIFPALVSQCLLRLEALEIDSCGIVEIFMEKGGIETLDRFIPTLTYLTLKNLKELKGFYRGKHISKWPLLEKLEVCNCDKVKILFQEIGLGGNLDDQVQQPFFLMEKLAFTKLEVLKIFHMENIKWIWHGQLSTVESFGNLKEVRVSHCGNLHCVFPSSFIHSLLQLQTLEIDSCGIEEIFMEEDGIETLDRFIPNLTYLTLKNLKELKGFYRGKHISKWPLLETLEVCNCDKVEILFQEIGLGGNLDDQVQQPFFMVEKVAFPSLEALVIYNLANVEKIWHNEFTADSFGKIKRLYVQSCQKLQNVIPPNMLKRLSSLQILKIVDCNSVEEVFDEKAIYRSESQDIPALQLRELWLDNLKNLKRVWNKAPTLFQNLRSVRVSHCPRLEIPYPDYEVRSLLQVKEVDTNSRRVEELVAHEDIAKAVTMFLFPKVTSLANSCPKELPCFYLGLHTLKWPMLKTLEVECFESLEMSTSKLDDPVENPIFLCDKVAFPSLEDLEISNLDNVEKIWHNEFAADSFGKIKRLYVQSCQNLQNVIPPYMLKRLSSLHILKIVDCDSVEEVFDLKDIDSMESHDIPALQLRELCLDNLKNLKRVWNKAPHPLLTYPNLHRVRVSHCPSLEIPYPGYVVRSLLKLKEVDTNSRRVEEIVALEDIAKAVTMFLFPEVTSLANSCPKEFTCFYLGLHTLEWPMLKTLEVECCGSLEMSTSKLDDPVENPIFLCDKVAFPNLEFLNLSLKLEEIQDLQVLFGTLSNLKILIVENCPFLSILFSPQFIRCLNNLEKLTVKKCGKLEEVFDLEGLKHGGDEHVEMLSKLEELSLIDLPNLKYMSKNIPLKVSCFRKLKVLQVKLLEIKHDLEVFQIL